MVEHSKHRESILELDCLYMREKWKSSDCYCGTRDYRDLAHKRVHNALLPDNCTFGYPHCRSDCPTRPPVTVYTRHPGCVSPTSSSC